MNPQEIKYQFYPSLIDAYEGWRNSDKIWEEYWGGSEKPSKSPEEFEAEQLQGLLDKINRVPHEPNEAADKGTAFNEVVDMIIHHRATSDIVTAASDKQAGVIRATMLKEDSTKQTFEFSIPLCREFADYYKGAVSQMFVEGTIGTIYGTVRLYGYADEVLEDGTCCDIKTTKQYKAGKFKNNTQHLAYPYCLNQMGIPCNDFEYNVTDFKSTFTEHYSVDLAKVETELRERCEQFIEFLFFHKDLITDTKIFNQ